MEHIVQLDCVSKSFAGRLAVEDLSFSVGRGEVFALLGPNGAGKTTTVRMLVGVIRPDHGRIIATVEGRTTDVIPAASVGYLPEDRGLYRDIPVLRTLVYFARCAIVASVALLVATIWFVRLLAGRIFEIGMLMYGKEPTFGEMLRWASSKSDRR